MVHFVIVAGIVLVTMTALAMCSRKAARWMLQTSGLDDHSFNLPCAGQSQSNSKSAVRHGLGRHHNEVGDDDYSEFLKLQSAVSIMYSCCMLTAKTSFAVLYLRIFPEGGFRVVNKILIVFLFVQATAETCAVLFRCSPIRKSWDYKLKGSCLDLHPLWYCTFACNFSTDMILFIEPIPLTWRLQLPLAKRLALIIMLSLGLLVTCISVVRVVCTSDISSDDTYELADPYMWAMIEFSALIICSCIPSLRQVVARIPNLNSALGLSTAKGVEAPHGRLVRNNLSIQFRRRSRKGPAQSQASKTLNRDGGFSFGTTSFATATTMNGVNLSDSQEDIFPYRSDQSSAIMVTTELQHHVESSMESGRKFSTFTDGMSEHQDESINDTEM
ncbi:hypothetical protein GGR52DRAFT_568228 [Hypoxylon sp. FL1284]|nr:hypothetical protein GGR52DRAFT_568228 [Hypoxylon sp. FL1284]